MLVRKASRRPRLSSRLGQQKESAPFLPQARLWSPILFFFHIALVELHHILLRQQHSPFKPRRKKDLELADLEAAAPFSKRKKRARRYRLDLHCSTRLDSDPTAAATHPRLQSHSSASTAAIHFLASCLYLNNIPSQYTVAVRHCIAAHYQLHDSPIV
jgi:hypothetical protein